MKIIKLTLCMVTESDKILLGYKKRGFGEGLWNGFGGKVHTDEAIEAATHRELEEEAGITVKDLEQKGLLNFTFTDTPTEVLEVHIYQGKGVIGEPTESEEMRPEWFRFNDIPYELMWPDDIFWLPKFLEGKKFKGAFQFGQKKNIVKHELSVEGEN